jgi:hypothetical protein
MVSVIYLFVFLLLMAVSGVLVFAFFYEGNADNLWAALFSFVTSCAFLHTAIKNRSEAQQESRDDSKNRSKKE